MGATITSIDNIMSITVCQEMGQPFNKNYDLAGAAKDCKV
jgi:hypothetical protein